MIRHPYVIGNQCNVFFQGFETRGTPISARLSAWSNLVDSISHAGPLTANPLEGGGGRLMSLKEKRPKQKRRRKNGAKKQKRGRNNRGRKRNDSQVRLVQTLNSGGKLGRMVNKQGHSGVI